MELKIKECFDKAFEVYIEMKKVDHTFTSWELTKDFLYTIRMNLSANSGTHDIEHKEWSLSAIEEVRSMLNNSEYYWSNYLLFDHGMQAAVDAVTKIINESESEEIEFTVLEFLSVILHREYAFLLYNKKEKNNGK